MPSCVLILREGRYEPLKTITAPINKSNLTTVTITRHSNDEFSIRPHFALIPDRRISKPKDVDFNVIKTTRASTRLYQKYSNPLEPVKPETYKDLEEHWNKTHIRLARLTKPPIDLHPKFH